jgi:hypothetical protein
VIEGFESFQNGKNAGSLDHQMARGLVAPLKGEWDTGRQELLVVGPIGRFLRRTTLRKNED